MRQYLVALGLFFSLSANVSAVTLYQSDFESAVDTGTNIVDGPYSLIQGVGDVSLGTFGALDQTALIFNQESGQDGEGLELDLGLGYSSYHIEFDLYSSNLIDSQHSFGIGFDSSHPEQVLRFGNCCNNAVYMFNGSTNSLGYLIDDQLLQVSIDIDLTNSLWSASVAGIGGDTVSLSSGQADVETLRFMFGSAHGAVGPDPSVTVGMDNLTITASGAPVPLPAAIWLFGSALAGLGWLRRRPVL